MVTSGGGRKRRRRRWQRLRRVVGPRRSGARGVPCRAAGATMASTRRARFEFSKAGSQVPVVVLWCRRGVTVKAAASPFFSVREGFPSASPPFAPTPTVGFPRDPSRVLLPHEPVEGSEWKAAGAVRVEGVGKETSVQMYRRGDRPHWPLWTRSFPSATHPEPNDDMDGRLRSSEKRSRDSRTSFCVALPGPAHTHTHTYHTYTHTHTHCLAVSIDLHTLYVFLPIPI